MESITFSNLVLWGIGGLVTLLTYFVKGTMDMQKDHEKQLNDLHNKYLKKDDFRDFKEELWSRLDDIKQVAQKNGK